MHGEYIAFDLETTGLDPARDEIIEIGAARFRSGEIVDQFQSLIKPSIPIPSDITHLTGIHQEDVEDAPQLEDLRPRLSRFFGDLPLVAHNAQFDLAFMRKQNMLSKNSAFDTFELASMLLPSAPRYNLHSLTTQLNIRLERAHRAYDDAAATGHLYWQLWLRLCDLPTALLSELIQASARLEWPLRPILQAALAESLQTGAAAGFALPFVAEESPAAPLDLSQARHERVPEVEVAAQFQPGGKLAERFRSYEVREQQVDMARQVAQALNRGEQVMIEAGTGTGKSIAYLLPAAQWALRNGQRVTVSTHTINLQEQLLHKDIPLVRDVVGGGLRAALMKGRGNYLCPRRLQVLRRRGPATLDEVRTLGKILVWMQKSASGDRGEITLRAGEWAVWSRLSAQDAGCSTYHCAQEMAGVCPFYRARQRAAAAHIVITNHALLIADARVENRALPAYHNLVVDEAHHLEDAITSGLSRRFDQRGILGRLRDLGGVTGGTLGSFLGVSRDYLPQADNAKLRAFVANIDDTVGLMRALIRQYFSALYDYAKGRSGGNRYAMRLRDADRDSGSFAPVRTAWSKLAPYFLALTDALEHLCTALPRYDQYDMPDFADYRSEIGSHWRYLAELHEQLESFTQAPAGNSVYSLTAGDYAERLQLQVSPLHVGPMMEEYLSGRLESIVLTSATLRTQGSFDHIRERLFIEDFKSSALESPFDYRRSTLLYIPDDVPEPSQRNAYQRMLERGIIELAAALDGRVMALFTSYAQLRETSKAITSRLQLGDIMVYDQSFGGSRDALLQNFRNAEKAVLMGTRSFWEGVDIPGDDLSAVVIAKLPFAVPSDPLFSARSEGYSNAFQDYAVPDAILRFRQGFGRLIRRRTDCGVVVAFDSRILSKSYGRGFLESLPDCSVKYGPLSQLAADASAWVERAGAG